MLRQETKELLIGIFKERGFKFDHETESKQDGNITRHVLVFSINKLGVLYQVEVTVNEAPKGFTVIYFKVFSNQRMWNFKELSIEKQWRLMVIINSLNVSTGGFGWVCTLFGDDVDTKLIRLQLTESISFPSGISTKNKKDIAYCLAHLNKLLDQIHLKFATVGNL